MKITPIASTQTLGTSDMSGNIQNSAVQKLRMTTNANPQQILPPELMPQATDTSVNKPAEATVEVTQPLSPQLALLAKQKRALQVKERELQEREKALLSKDSGNPSIEVARLKSEPLRVLLENGVTYEQLTEAILNNPGGQNSEVMALKQEIEALRQGLDKKFADRDADGEKQVLAEMQREANLIVGQNDDFELVRETKSVPKAIELIRRTHRETGELLDVTEALRLVEEELFKDAQRLAQLKKIQAQFAPQQNPQLRPPVMRTLTNRDTASVPMSAKARALAAFYGTLKR